jgi:hypothetical protein
VPNHQRLSFDEAARRALFAEAQSLPLRVKLAEWLLHRVTPQHDKVLKKQLERHSTSGAA